MMKQNNTWKGYSFEELRYQRALTTIKCEIEKEKINAIITNFKQSKLSVVGGANGNSLLGKMMSALDIADYSLMAFRVGRKLFSIFRNRKSR